jgi:AcrR family transcriptional regulator
MARPLSLEAHGKVLRAAREVLYERGLDRFTVDAVAARSGVAKTTIYRHFPSVHVLLIGALHDMMDPVPTPNTGSLRDDLLELFVKSLPMVEDPHLRPIVLGLLSASTSNPDLDAVATTMTEHRTEPIRTIV